jgi:FkbM family methyltransferase
MSKLSSLSRVMDVPVLNRIKVIKQLFLQKLDEIQASLQTLNRQAQTAAEQWQQTDQTLQTLTENDVALLSAAIDSVEALNMTQQALNSSQQALSDNRDEVQQQRQMLVAMMEKLQENQQEVQHQQQVLAAVIDQIHRALPKFVCEAERTMEPEHGLVTHLYSYLPNRTAIDIGANIGDFSEALLGAGYEVFAFEPFPPVYEQMKQRFGERKAFHSFPLALGAADETKDLYIATDQSPDNLYGRSDLYSSLVKHSMPGDLIFTDQVSVSVKTLQEMHESSLLPETISLVKIDTEGNDLEVIRGMGDYRYPVVITEFWDQGIPFAQSGVDYTLEQLVNEMRSRAYYWHLVVYRVWGEDGIIRFYCNSPKSVDQAWGNVFFFQDWKVFEAAMQWCSAALPTAYVQ